MRETVEHLGAVLDHANQSLRGRPSLEGDLWPEANDDDDSEANDVMAQSERARTYLFMQAITAAGIPLNA
jgi:hypothetical protein